MEKRIILSLFDYTGNWPYYFGWDRDRFTVIQVDLKRGRDILTYQPPKRVYGLLAAPPCQSFAVSGARWWKDKDEDGRTEVGLALVMRTLEILHDTRPEFWMLENPVGRLNRWLGRPVEYFHPYEYAGYAPHPADDAYTKKTALWGQFELPPKKPVEPVFYTTKDGKRGSWQWAHLGGASERTKTLRSITPIGFSRATWIGNR